MRVGADIHLVAAFHSSWRTTCYLEPSTCCFSFFVAYNIYMYLYIYIYVSILIQAVSKTSVSNS